MDRLNLSFGMRFYIVFLVAAFAFLKSNAQNPNPFSSFQNLVKVGTTSPQAASLGKFGNVPVSPFTGVPSVTIPVYDISVAGINIPISLDYHAGGIRVDETSSSVGIGWALNGGGVVSRNVVGIPDQIGRNPDPQLVANSPATYYEHIYNIRNNSDDADPDVFQYSVNGISGKFIFKSDGSIMQIPVTNNKIVYNGNFTITDANGTIYIFEEKRWSRSSETSVQQSITTWCLTKMIDANLVDTIFFTYESNIYRTHENIVNYSYVFGNSLGVISTNCLDGSYAEYPTSNGGSGLNRWSQLITHEEYYPKEITWRGGKILFNNADDRTDLTGTGLRLNSIEIYSYQNDAYSLVKKIDLYQSYFYSPPKGNDIATDRNFRLKLDSVGNIDIQSNKIVQVHTMKYNTTSIAPRESFAQDKWGFNNGSYSNETLMPRQTVLYKGTYSTFGDADRETNAFQSLACSLSSITYPTKGRTDFVFEPHRYNTKIPPKPVLKSSYHEIKGDNGPTYHNSFTVPANRKNYRYQVKFSKFNYPNVTDRPRIKMKDQASTNDDYLINESNLQIDQPYTSGVVQLNLLEGHTYDIDINIYTTNSAVSAYLELSFEETLPESQEIKIGGGLRVQTITNYDATGHFISKELYQYGNGGGGGIGTVLTPQYYQDINYETVVHRLGYSPCGIALSYITETTLFPNPGYSTIYHANSVLPTSQYAGSPVVYGEVTKMQVDSLGNPNGKTVYGYGVYEDGGTTPFEPITGILTNFIFKGGMSLISSTWKNGNLLFEEVHKKTPTGYQLINSTVNHYTLGLEDLRKVLKVQSKYIHSGSESIGPSTAVTDFMITVVPVYTGAMLLDKKTITTKDDNGKELIQVQNISYGSTPLLPSSIDNSSSTGVLLTEKMKYPLDLAAPGNVYQKMVDRNMLAPVVQHQAIRAGSSLTKVNINYNDWFSDSKLLLPQSVNEQVRTNPSEERIQFNSYDSYGNILQQRKANNVISTYLWGYNHLYPVGEITNATYQELRDVLGQTVIDKLNDNPGTDDQVRQTLQVLRTSPLLKKALITTFTYTPLVGMTSTTDTNGFTTYYEYDTFNRLMFIRDKDQNILKRYEYNYQIR